MKSIKNIFTKKRLLLLLSSGLAVSCTKSVPYKEVYKEKVHEKSSIDTSAEYLYIASTDRASST
ncbi:MAG: hypothetical protein AAGB31_14200 [Bdellovibrio sp.]